jgi:hypothetical protein
VISQIFSYQLAPPLRAPPRIFFLQEHGFLVSNVSPCTTYVKQMAFDKISVVIRLHRNTTFAYLITIPLLMSFTKPFPADKDAGQIIPRSHG